MSLHRLLTLYFYVILLLNVWAAMSKSDQLYTFYVGIYVYCRIWRCVCNLRAIACPCNCIGIGHIFHNICPQCRGLKMPHPWLQLNCFTLIPTILISKLQLSPVGFKGMSFFLLWTYLCLFKSAFSLKHFLHWLQGNGLSPEWIRSCTFNEYSCVKDFVQSLQL